MFDTVFGLPVHALVVHAVVVLAPLSALMLLLFSVSERFRRWSGWLTPALTTLTFVLAFVAKESGESLERRIGGGGELVEEHAELGDLLPWVVLAAAVVAWVFWAFWRREFTATTDAGTRSSSSLLTILAVLGVVAGLGLAVDVALVGHSGAKAVWSGIGSQPAPSGEGDE